MQTESQLAEAFEDHRSHLISVATRLLGNQAEADDAVQESWLRLQRAGQTEILNLRAWLTTVIGRICLDMLRSRKSRGEEVLEPEHQQGVDTHDPEQETILQESIGIAMEAVIQRLAPAERVAFVLHDVFDVPFTDIAPIVDRTLPATRQLASRARRRVREHELTESTPQEGLRQRVVEAFFRASRAGDFNALLTMLDPDVVLRPDATAMLMGSRNGWIKGDLHGALAVAEQFNGRAAAAQVAIIDGQPGGVWATGGVVRVAFVFTLGNDKVTGIHLVADPQRIGEMRIQVLDQADI